MDKEKIGNILPQITELRQELHRNPELSGQEYGTARRLEAFLQQYSPDQLLTGLGSGTGMAAIFKGTSAGPTLMFRADMDALPIPETITAPYGSQQRGISHKCGHDGHMAMVAGLAPLLKRYPPNKGAVILLMQPAEETGMGAAALLEDPRFNTLTPDYIFGLHNLPGFPLGQVVLREGTFCAASRGLRIVLKGRTSHAAEPSLGISPANALAKLLLELPLIPQKLPCKDLLLLTITHATLGEASFGISPGEAILHLTLRANQEADMQQLIAAAEQSIKVIALENSLQVDFSHHEVFPVTRNAPSASTLLRAAAKKTGFDLHEKEVPFRWSEDFGHYSQLAPAAFFGIGAGENLPNLHNPHYDFPDALLPYGLEVFWSLVQEMSE